MTMKCKVTECGNQQTPSTILCGRHEAEYKAYARKAALPRHRSGWARQASVSTATTPAQPSALDGLLTRVALMAGIRMEMAREALKDDLASLVAEVRADEREACARVAIDVADGWRAAVPLAEDAGTKEVAEWAERACMDVAHSIRARRG